MASILRVNTLTDASSNNSVPMATVAQGSAKVRAQYMGLTNTLQTGALNNSSVTDNATGDFTHAFSSSFSDIKYSVVGGVQYLAGTSLAIAAYGPQDNTARETGQVRMESHFLAQSANRANFDHDVNDLVCYGDLA